MQHFYLFTLISSRCFGRCFRPSSGAYHCNYSCPPMCARNPSQQQHRWTFTEAVVHLVSDLCPTLPDTVKVLCSSVEMSHKDILHATFLLLQMKPSNYLETSGSNQPVPQGHIPCKLTVVYYTQCGHMQTTLLRCKEVGWGTEKFSDR